jgi:hypothetical protein
VVFKRLRPFDLSSTIHEIEETLISAAVRTSESKELSICGPYESSQEQDDLIRDKVISCRDDDDGVKSSHAEKPSGLALPECDHSSDITHVFSTVFTFHPIDSR